MAVKVVRLHKKRGRPVEEGYEGLHIQVSFRCPEDLARQLHSAAKKADRSMSKEIIRRLRASLARER